MKVISFNGGVFTAEYSCEGTYPCDTEGPGFYVMGYGIGTIVEE